MSHPGAHKLSFNKFLITLVPSTALLTGKIKPEPFRFRTWRLPSLSHLSVPHPKIPAAMDNTSVPWESPDG